MLLLPPRSTRTDTLVPYTTLFRSRQNDLVAVEPNGQDRKIMRVVKFSDGGQITFAEHQEAGPLKARDAASSDIDPFKYFYSSAGGLQDRKSTRLNSSH